MQGFFDAAYRLLRDDRGSISADHFDRIFDLLNNRLPLLRSKASADLQNLETVFSLIEMGNALGRIPAVGESELHQCATAIRCVLAETIQQYCRFPVDSEGVLNPQADYKRFIEGLLPLLRERPKSCSFITFNYDVALDFALHYHGVDIDYALPSSPPSNQRPTLLKLHGSLNWAFCSVCNEARALTMERLFTVLQMPLHKLAGRQVVLPVISRLSSLGEHCKGALPSTTPAVVPPSWNKTQYQQQLQSVWRRAALELSEAEHLFIVGYSFPQTDGFFRDLFALSVFGPARFERIYFVNPDATVGGRFRELLGPDAQARMNQVQSRFEDIIPEILRLVLGPSSTT